MRVRTRRVILACVAVATVVPAVALRADCPGPKELATREYEEKKEEELIERQASINELKLGNLPAKLAKEEMERDQWLESEKLAHQISLEKIDLEAAVSETAGRCLSMDELLRRCDVHARWKREAEELRYKHAGENARRYRSIFGAKASDAGRDGRQTTRQQAPQGYADKLAIIRQQLTRIQHEETKITGEQENQVHAARLAMIELTCAQQKEIIRARHGQCPYSEMKLQYVHELQRMSQEHRNKMQLARLKHESGLLELEQKRLQQERELLTLGQTRVPYESSLLMLEGDPAKRKANIEALIEVEKLRYPNTVALETLRYEHDLKRADPDLRWKVSTGRLGAGTLWMLKNTDAQLRREEEILRHRQVLEELELARSTKVLEPLAGIADTEAGRALELQLAEKKADIWYQRDVQKENALHRRTLRDIEALCPPRDSFDCRCSH